jgi:hypothetical protein
MARNFRKRINLTFSNVEFGIIGGLAGKAELKPTVYARHILLKHINKKEKVVNHLPKSNKAVSLKKKRMDLSISETDSRLINAKASLVGLKKTTYFRKCALAYVKSHHIPSKKIEDKLERLIYITSNMANNLNQIAKHCNSLKQATVFDLMKARKIIFNFEDTIEEFLKKD